MGQGIGVFGWGPEESVGSWRGSSALVDVVNGLLRRDGAGTRIGTAGEENGDDGCIRRLFRGTWKGLVGRGFVVRELSGRC